MNEVEEQHTSAYVTLCNGYDEAEVGFGKAFFSGFVPFHHAAGEVYLFVRAEEGHSADVL